MQRGYLEDLTGDLTRMRALVGAPTEDEGRPELKRLAHNIRGTGTGYGFPALSEAAGALEEAVRADLPPSELEGLVAALSVSVSAALAGVPSTEEAAP